MTEQERAGWEIVASSPQTALGCQELSIASQEMEDAMIEPKDRRAERKKDEERRRALVAAQNRIREEELRQLHLLASEVAGLIGGNVRSPVAGNAWLFVDLSEGHELSFYREGDQISIGGRDGDHRYALKVSARASSADVVKAIKKSGTHK